MAAKRPISRAVTEKNTRAAVNQTRFMGATIMSFNGKAAWGTDASEVSIELVEDKTHADGKQVIDVNPSNGRFFVKDVDSESSTDSFQPVAVGTPAYFYHSGFSHGGLLSNFEHSSSTSGKTKSVRVGGPSVVLSNARIILQGMDDYGLPSRNLINLPSVTGLPSWCNEIGTPWSVIKRVINKWAFSHRGHYYTLDIDAIPESSLKFDGTDVDVLSAIDRVAKAHGGRIRLSLQPTGFQNQHVIQAKISYASGLLIGGNNVMNSSKGKEPGDIVSHSVLNGENVHFIWGVTNEEDSSKKENNEGNATSKARIRHFWGTDRLGKPIVSSGKGNMENFTVDTARESFGNFVSSYNITVLELRAAAESYNSWYEYMAAFKTDILTLILGAPAQSSILAANLFNFCQGGGEGAGDPQAAQNDIKEHIQDMEEQQKRQDQLHALHQFVSAFHSFYGQKFFVELPIINCCPSVVDFPNLNYAVEKTDGGWPVGNEASTKILGLDFYSPGMETFKIDDGRVGPILFYDNIVLTDEADDKLKDPGPGKVLDFSKLTFPWYTETTKEIWVQASFEDIVGACQGEREVKNVAPAPNPPNNPGAGGGAAGGNDGEVGVYGDGTPKSTGGTPDLGDTGAAGYTPPYAGEGGESSGAGGGGEGAGDGDGGGDDAGGAANPANSAEGPGAVLTIGGGMHIRERDQVKAVDGLDNELLIFILQKHKGAALDGDEKTKLDEILQNHHAASVLRNLGLAPKVHMPQKAAVPIRSNWMSYGPWQNARPSDRGRSEYEKNQSFSPWNFGSNNAVSAAANTIVNSKVGGPDEHVSGSAKFAGSPSDAGITDLSLLSSISISMGVSGITTNVQARTFTRNFGELGQNRIEWMELIGKEQQKFQRAFNLKRLEKMANRGGGGGGAKGAGAGGPGNNGFAVGAGPKEIVGPGAANNAGALKDKKNQNDDAVNNVTIVARNYKELGEDDDGPNPTPLDSAYSSVSIQSLTTSLSETDAAFGKNWKKTAGCSLDALFRPFNLIRGGNFMSRWEEGSPSSPPDETPSPSCNFIGQGFNAGLQANESHCCPGASSPPEASPDPSTSTGPGPAIFNMTLNPYMSRDDALEYELLDPSLKPSEAMSFRKGTDIKRPWRNIDSQEGLRINPNTETLPMEQGIRSIGLRGPLVIVGWGYDTEGNPVPNKDGYNGKSPYFENNWLNKPQNWMSGPLDVRWDNDKRMWVPYTEEQTNPSTPPQGFIVYAILREELEPGGTGIASTVEESGGGSEKINVTNRMGQPLCKGQHIFAYYNQYGCEWVILQAEFMPVCVVTDMGAKTVSDSESSDPGASPKPDCVEFSATTRIIYVQSPPTIGVETRYAQAYSCAAGQELSDKIDECCSKPPVVIIPSVTPIPPPYTPGPTGVTPPDTSEDGEYSDS